jgi:FkbM family methyltransferase
MNRLRRILKSLKIALFKRTGWPARYLHGLFLHGQGLEDMFLVNLFRGHATGFFVDVGANDGVFISNTFALYRAGWRGMCLEPNPVAFARLKANRPEDTCLAIAAGSTRGKARLAWRSGITEGSRLGKEEGSTDAAIVDVVPLAELLETHGAPAEFELLCLDVEGFEMEVLNGLDFGRFRPRVVVIEYNSEGKVRTDSLEHLYAFGYRPILVNRWNMILSRHFETDVVAAHRSQDWYSLG